MNEMPNVASRARVWTRELVAVPDVMRLFQLLAGWGLTLLLPPRLDSHLLPAASRVYRQLRPESIDEVAGAMSRVPGLQGRDRDLRGTAIEYNQMRVEGAWDHLRRLHRPRFDQVEAQVEGLDRYRAAQARGVGVILWRMRFCSSPIVNAGLFRAGVRMTHLSSRNHGLLGTGSWFGRRFTGPLYAKAECWYLDDRVVMGRGRVHRYLQDLIGLLESGGTLSIIGEHPGNPSVSVPFCNGFMPFATGAPGLGYRVGSPLLPVHAYRLEAHRYRVVIGEPIEVSREGGRAAFLEAAVAEYARRLEGNIVEHPASWMGWRSRLPAARDMP